MIYYLPSTILPALTPWGIGALGQDYTPLLGGESAKAVAKHLPHTTDSTLIFYTLRVYTIRRSATFHRISGFLLYISTYLWVYLYRKSNSLRYICEYIK